MKKAVNSLVWPLTHCKGDVATPLTNQTTQFKSSRVNGA